MKKERLNHHHHIIYLNGSTLFLCLHCVFPLLGHRQPCEIFHHTITASYIYVYFLRLIQAPYLCVCIPDSVPLYLLCCFRTAANSYSFYCLVRNIFKNAHHSFPDHKVMSSNCVVHPTKTHHKRQRKTANIHI